jgi:hypothetical protein
VCLQQREWCHPRVAGTVSCLPGMLTGCPSPPPRSLRECFLAKHAHSQGLVALLLRWARGECIREGRAQYGGQTASLLQPLLWGHCPANCAIPLWRGSRLLDPSSNVPQHVSPNSICIEQGIQPLSPDCVTALLQVCERSVACVSRPCSLRSCNSWVASHACSRAPVPFWNAPWSLMMWSCKF